MKTSGFETARRFFIDAVQVKHFVDLIKHLAISQMTGCSLTFFCVQISPLQRPKKWDSVATFSFPSSKTFAFPAEGGLAMELAIAQFWSSGVGIHETTVVDLEVTFLSL